MSLVDTRSEENIIDIYTSLCYYEDIKSWFSKS